MKNRLLKSKYVEMFKSEPENLALLILLMIISVVFYISEYSLFKILNYLILFTIGFKYNNITNIVKNNKEKLIIKILSILTALIVLIVILYFFGIIKINVIDGETEKLSYIYFIMLNRRAA